MTDSEKLRELQSGWRVPHELERSRPRPVRFTAAGKALILLAVALVGGGIALGVGLNATARRQQARARLLTQSTGRAEGRITRLWRQNRGKETRCYASYQFTASGATWDRVAGIGCSVMRALREDQIFPVRYVDSDPAISRLEGLERSSDIPIWLPAVLPFVFVAFVFLIWRELSRQRRLLEEGRPAPALVTRLGRRSQHGREVFYEFLTLGGSRVEGKFGPVHGRKQPEIGASLTVIYDADDSKFNKRYPLSLVAVGE